VAGTSSATLSMISTLSTVASPTTDEVGDIIAGGLGESRWSSSTSAASSGPAQQTANAGARNSGYMVWSHVIGFLLAFTLR
jgi:hypothetical protein